MSYKMSLFIVRTFVASSYAFFFFFGLNDRVVAFLDVMRLYYKKFEKK